MIFTSIKEYLCSNKNVDSIHMFYICQMRLYAILIFIGAKKSILTNKGIITMFCGPYLLLLHLTWFLFYVFNNIIALDKNTNTKDDSFGLPPLMAVNSTINIIQNSCTQQIGDILPTNWFMSFTCIFFFVFIYYRFNFLTWNRICSSRNIGVIE